MAFANHVSEHLWNSRYDWLRECEKREAGEWGSVLLSSHGTLISYDVEIAFCAGAWISVVVLSHAAIDATIRDTDTGDYRSPSVVIFGNDEDLDWLRKIRNQLVHVADPEKKLLFPNSDIDQIESFHDTLEDDAKRAAALLYRTIYANPGT